MNWSAIALWGYIVFGMLMMGGVFGPVPDVGEHYAPNARANGGW